MNTYDGWDSVLIGKESTKKKPKEPYVSLILNILLSSKRRKKNLSHNAMINDWKRHVRMWKPNACFMLYPTRFQAMIIFLFLQKKSRDPEP